MDIKTAADMLAESARSSDGKYIPWWEDDFEHCGYQDNIFTAEEVRQIEECVRECGAEALSAPAGEAGYTLFHLLVWHNFYEAVKRALEDGADADPADKKGRGGTPLLLSCCRSNLAMAKLLLAHGADASCRDAKGRSCFHYLAHQYAEGMEISEDFSHSLDQREALVRLLADKADINQGDQQGIPPIVYLVDGGSRQICCALIDAFLEKGADPYFIDEGGGTLLLRAIVRQRSTAALRLMEYKDLINQTTQRGTTPLSAAMDRREEGICIALKDHGAEGPCALAEVDVINLARIANNALLDAFGQRRDTDQLSLAVYLVKKLMAIAEEDEDYGCLEDIVDHAMMDENARLLDLFHEGGINFIEPYYGGASDVSCLRDKCLEYCRHAGVIKKFIDLGVNMNRAVIAGRTPASILARCPGAGGEAFQLLSPESMEQRDNTGRAAIHYAAAGGNVDALSAMLKKGVNAGLTQDAPAEAGNTPLHLACIYGKADVARTLIEFGADDTARNTNGETPAHYIVTENRHRSELSTEERRELLSLLPDIDIARNDGKTPLMLLMTLEASKVDKEELLPVLLEKGAGVNRADNEGNTALLLCVRNHGWSLKLVKALCKAGADWNAVDQEGNSALHYVLESGSEEAASYLLKKGADYNRINRDGVSPAQIAVEKGYDTLLTWMPDIR